MSSYLLTPSAENDLFELWAYIATDNISAADRLEDDIFQAIARLVKRPDIGHFRRDLTDQNLRFFNVRGICLIVFEARTTPLNIVRILHGARDATTELSR
jgi:antitoxin ParD1/3/4